MLASINWGLKGEPKKRLKQYFYKYYFYHGGDRCLLQEALITAAILLAFGETTDVHFITNQPKGTHASAVRAYNLVGPNQPLDNTASIAIADTENGSQFPVTIPSFAFCRRQHWQASLRSLNSKDLLLVSISQDRWTKNLQEASSKLELPVTLFPLTWSLEPHYLMQMKPWVKSYSLQTS